LRVSGPFWFLVILGLVLRIQGWETQGAAPGLKSAA
jgi:hypothetical protein